MIEKIKIALRVATIAALFYCGYNALDAGMEIGERLFAPLLIENEQLKLECERLRRENEELREQAHNQNNAEAQ